MSRSATLVSFATLGHIAHQCSHSSTNDIFWMNNSHFTDTPTTAAPDPHHTVTGLGFLGGRPVHPRRRAVGICTQLTNAGITLSRRRPAGGGWYRAVELGAARLDPDPTRTPWRWAGPPSISAGSRAGTTGLDPRRVRQWRYNPAEDDLPGINLDYIGPADRVLQRRRPTKPSTTRAPPRWAT